MSANTGIEWTDRTWNPVTGCDRISEGCDNCYALTMAKRLKAMGSAKYQNDGDPRTSGPGFGVTVHPAALAEPATWRDPSLVFVNSMSDVFHARVPLSFVQDVFDVIASTPRHTYQVLTKRSLRLARIADRLNWPGNLWMGVSVESTSHLDRVDHLRQVPAAVRFLSCEPLLGPLASLDLDGIGWVIVGGESGPGARPMHPDWARSIRDQCVADGVPFLFKQWGQWAPGMLDFDRAVGIDRNGHALPDFNLDESQGHAFVTRVGKKAAGRVLDGRTWDEYPVGAA
jgi:protein gp37